MRMRGIAARSTLVALVSLVGAGAARAADETGEGKLWTIGLDHSEGDRVARCEPTPQFVRLAGGQRGGAMAAVAADRQTVAAYLDGPALTQEQVLILDLRGEVVRRFPLYEVGECAERWRGARRQPVPPQVIERVRVLNEFLRAGGYRGMRPVERDPDRDEEGRRSALRHGKLQIALEVEAQRLVVRWAGGAVLTRRIPSARGPRGRVAREVCGSEFPPGGIEGWVFQGYAVVMVWYSIDCLCNPRVPNAWVGPVRLP